MVGQENFTSKNMKNKKESSKDKKREWEEGMLENNSYWDIDILNQYNSPILEEIRYWEEEYKPSSNMGKWWASIQISRLKKKLSKYQNKKQ
jgi:hypothetical protein